MNIIQKRLHLITYGRGANLDIAKFEAIHNQNFIKPSGGLWASPINSRWGWRDWCKVNDFGDLISSFTFWFEGNILVIDSLKHAEEMPWRNPYDFPSLIFPDFEKIAEAGVDAIHLTEKGQQETRFGTPSLYGWDCECVLIINPDGLEI